MTSPTIVGVEIVEPSSISIRWADGSTTRHDLSEMISHRKWALPLKDPAVFQHVTVSSDGRELRWPETDIELSADGLWEEVHPRLDATVPWMSPAQFREWIHEMRFTWDEAAQALGIGRRIIGYYLDGTQEIPKAIWLACMQLASKAYRAKVSGAAIDLKVNIYVAHVTIGLEASSTTFTNYRPSSLRRNSDGHLACEAVAAAI